MEFQRLNTHHDTIGFFLADSCILFISRNMTCFEKDARTDNGTVQRSRDG